MLQKWLETYRGETTYQYLAVALEQIGRLDLVSKYCYNCSNGLEGGNSSSFLIKLKEKTFSNLRVPTRLYFFKKVHLHLYRLVF